MEGDVREDALDVLRDALVWRLTDGRWRVVGQAVEVLASALDAGDTAAFRKAVYDLELAGPVRAARFEDPPTVPTPDPVRERVNELIHTLDGSRPVVGQDSDDEPADAAG